MIHVCPLSRVPDTVAAARASHFVSLICYGTLIRVPASIDRVNHLFLGMHDICEPTDGLLHPCAEHVAELLRFVRAWLRRQAIVIHCYAGISRSTAAAFIAACVLWPERDEAEVARALRNASAIATPNRQLVAVADEHLGRYGRMVAAIEAIGRGTEAYEGEPFMLALR